MNYNIKGTSIDISDELRAYAERQLAQADKFCNGDTSAHADVELENIVDGRSGKYRAEFTLQCAGALYRASATGTTMHEAMDVAGQELVAELRKHKSKRLQQLRHTAVRVKEYLRGWRGKI